MPRLSLASLSLIALLAPALGQAAPAAGKAKPAATCDRPAFRVVLDVGHTLETPGAISARGATEYAFNLRLAGEIVKALAEAGFTSTSILVSAGDKMRGLIQRVSQVNREPGDLLLSIHHDAVPEQFLEDWEYEGQPQRFSDRFRGHSIFVSLDNAQSRASLNFAKLLGAELKELGLQYTPHYTEAFMGGRRRVLLDRNAGVYRFDQLYVLRASQTPAVLLEAGNIKNRDEELQLAATSHRALLVASAVEAIGKFCDLRAPR
ncbi:MAG: N-acetylmuramoyl-L-alanine amidase, partial [Pseudorhodoplanes sp.]|nr:N-acetylmuramoyl-L-alanine amidase [Pseudorhodoplanes sp.]